MSKPNNGGPAFPGTALIHHGGIGSPATEYITGMSLRDYFAAAAMQGLLSGDMDVYNPRAEVVTSAVVELAFDYADAMLAERNKK